MTQSELLSAIRSRGCDAQDIRDAAHEATHAIQSRVRGTWERERIHAALERRALREVGRRLLVTEMIRYELQARAVEMLACAHYGVDYDAMQWAMWCAMETAKTYRVDVGPLDRLAEAVVISSKQRRTLELFDAVMRTKPRLIEGGKL